MLPQVLASPPPYMTASHLLLVCNCVRMFLLVIFSNSKARTDVKYNWHSWKMVYKIKNLIKNIKRVLEKKYVICNSKH